MEYFYRQLRESFGVLMDGGEPAGGQWNYDAENRGAFPKAGRACCPRPHASFRTPSPAACSSS